MQDLKKNKKRINNQKFTPTSNKINEQEKYIEENLYEELDRGCGCKHNHNHDNNGCHMDDKCECHMDDKCECKNPCKQKDECHKKQKDECHKKPVCCEPCEIESDICVPNPCGPKCSEPITAPRFSPANSVPVAIEASRIFDTMVFQTFADATPPVNFEFDVIEVNGPVPRGGKVNVTIEKICMNFSDIRIDPGTTTLDGVELEPLGEFDGLCETNFEYAVCGEVNNTCCRQGKGKNAAYKERGLTVTVKDITLELKGRCGCTEITAIAFPRPGASKDARFVFNTLSAPIGIPADGRSFILRQSFQTSLTVDCIDKVLLECECNCQCELTIPNDIDLVLCLQSTVSTLINEQIVVLGSPNAIQPRIVDSFSKVCDFNPCNNNNNI